MRTMRKDQVLLASAMLLLVALPLAADEDEGLPEGPILDRHELMEEIGGQAKKIGNALKSGKTEEIPAAADTIRVDAARMLALFPPDSVDPLSRAKPAIWENWNEFEALAKDFEKSAAELAAAARTGGDVAVASKKMFHQCKTCHEGFRVPED
jgi:cytochrome c556